jgi:hypothetical protein
MESCSLLFLQSKYVCVDCAFDSLESMINIGSFDGFYENYCSVICYNFIIGGRVQSLDPPSIWTPSKNHKLHVVCARKVYCRSRSNKKQEHLKLNMEILSCCFLMLVTFYFHNLWHCGTVTLIDEEHVVVSILLLVLLGRAEISCQYICMIFVLNFTRAVY